MCRRTGCAGRRGTGRRGPAFARGMSSTRSLITLRAISTVPPPMLPAWRMMKFVAVMEAALSSVQAAPAAGRLESQGGDAGLHGALEESAHRGHLVGHVSRPDRLAHAVHQFLAHQLEHARLADQLAHHRIVHAARSRAMPSTAAVSLLPGSSPRARSRTTRGVQHALVEHPACPHGPTVVDVPDTVGVGDDHIGHELLAELPRARSNISIRCTSTPGWWIGSMNTVKPRCFGTSQLVRARHSPQSDHQAPDVHTFDPFDTHWSPSCTAVVRAPATSKNRRSARTGTASRAPRPAGWRGGAAASAPRCRSPAGRWRTATAWAPAAGPGTRDPRAPR